MLMGPSGDIGPWLAFETRLDHEKTRQALARASNGTTAWGEALRRSLDGRKKETTYKTELSSKCAGGNEV